MAPKGRDPVPGKKSPRKTGRDPKLSGEERALWDLVTRDAEPLKKPPSSVAPPAKTAPHPDKPPEAAAKRAVKRTASSSPAKPPPKPKPPAPSLGHGDITDLDKRSAERLRRGRTPIEGTLDLHGYTQDQARRELAAYLADAQAAGKRCIVVVTGKGDIVRGGGVLRAQVPHWLNDPENRARVLAFNYAQPRHGGMGALYVLLRKART